MQVLTARADTFHNRAVNANEPVTGHLLKVRRVDARVKAVRLADAMGVSNSRISAIEREQFPSDEIVARYLDALDTCRNVRNNGAAV